MKQEDPTSVGVLASVSWLRPIAAALSIIAVAALVLLAMGRAPFCNCGRVALWAGDAWGAENSQQFFDPYTFTHILHGFLFYALFRLVTPGSSVTTRWLLTVTVESLWEVLENTNAVIDRYREVTMALGYYGDTVLNSMGDIVACAIGFMLAARLPVRTCVAFAALIELVLLVLIRDGLLLNLIMLVHPINGIREWQLAGHPH